MTKKMKIKIKGIEYYLDLRTLKEAEISLMIKLFGKPKHKEGYDRLLGDNFKSKFIGYIPDGGGELQTPTTFQKLLLLNVPHTRKVFLCEYKGKYWFSLEYYGIHYLEFPRYFEWFK